MTRIRLTGEDTGKWFDLDTAIRFDEDTQWDGRNHISRATGSEWDHEALYYTKSGRWVLYHVSAWQGSLPSNTEIQLDAAVAWLVVNDGVADVGFNLLPEEIRQQVEAAIAAREV